MARKDSSDCVVTVTIELGHQANFLKEPSPEGFTHDWTVFVRGYEGSRIEYFVEKVVFKLHKTFKSPVRVVSEPPFKVTESGYAGFILPIEIHFRNKQTPRKIAFFYDLFLNAKDSPPINNVRYEKLKFQNPTPEFKAKLIKAGGTEQGAEPVPYPELFGSPVRSEKKLLPKIPKDKERDKDKIKKKKKSSPHTKSSSPAPSLSSLSSMSSDDDDESYAAPLPPPPPPVKKEKEVSVKKESSSSSSSQPKQESLPSSSSLPSPHKDKVKHRSSSSSSSHKDRTGLDKDASHRPHKHKDKDRDRSSSHKEREGGKKEKDSSSQKVSKEREGSHTSSKSSTLSSQHENKTPTVHKDKERSSQSKEKDTSGSSSKTKSSKEKDKNSSKEKHFSSKAISPSLVPESTKVKEESSKEKSKDKDRHKKIHKRPYESGSREGESEKKKQKSSSSVTGSDDRPVKPKTSSGKESSKEKELPKESSKEVKDRDSKSSSMLGKSKHEKNRHSDQHRHSHSSDSKPKESPVKKAEMPLKSEKAGKSEALTQSERLAMTADFQPQLLLSPLKNKSDEEESLAPSPVTETKKLKRSTSNSSLGSQSFVSSSDGADPKSDHEMQEPPADKDSHIVSGLTDSDSDSEEETPYMKSPQKELKSNLSKQATQTTLHVISNKSSANKVARGISVDEKQKKTDQELVENGTKGSDQTSKHSKEDRRTVNVEDSKSAKPKYSEATVDSSDDDANVEKINVTNGTSDHNCNGLDILAPNGISIGELIAINEKIEKAQADSNQELLEKVIRVIGETDDFDLNDVFLCFDICSVDKSVVQQIQAVLREF